MIIKGLVEIDKKNKILETSNLSEKPLNTKGIRSNRVDINILKSKLKDNEKKEFKKNLIIFISFLTTLAGLGIYLSY